MLRAAAGRFQLQRAGIEGEVAAAKLDGRGVLFADADHASAGAAGGAVDAVIEPPAEGVDQALHVAAAETGEDLATDVGRPVAVGVFEVVNVRRGGDEHAAVVADHGRGPGELVDVDAGAVEAAVAVGIGEHADFAQQIAGVFAVAAHADQEHAARGVEGDGDGVGQQRFGSDEIDAVAGQHFELLE